MKILLINPMSSRKPPVKGRKAHFPISLGLIAACLKENGFNVNVFDDEVECLNKYELNDFIRKTEYDVYGITGSALNYSYVKGLSRMIKDLKDKPVILGGPLSTYSYEVVLKNTDVNICVLGEGEETVIDLLDNMDNLEKVSGISYIKNGTVKKTQPRIFEKSRDEYPFTAYELFNMEPYLKKKLGQYEGWGSRYLNKDVSDIKTLGMITGVGCPYSCKFCTRSVSKTRMRSVDNIISEIKYCIDKFDIKGVRFLDDLLILNERRTLEFCEKIKPLHILWSGQARTDVINDRLANVMKKAGCVGIGFGYESGSDRLLKAMNKKVTVDDHRRATLAVKKSGIAIRVQIMFGYPGENKESIDETIKFFKEIEIPPRRFNILTPLPGSEIYDECIRKKIINDEIKYLEKVSALEGGFATKKVLINLTEMSDKEFEALLLYAEKTMEDNYKRIFKEKYRLQYFLMKHDFFQRLYWRIRKSLSIKAWKKKYKSFAHKTPSEPVLNKEQIEELYFKL